MRWDELADKEKVRLIIEHVIPYVPEGNDIRTPRGSNFLTAFDPLRNMNDAWQIVECAKFASVRVERLYKTNDERRYVCQIVSRCDDPSASIPIRAKIDVFGKTAQDAICKAALRAVGVKIDE